MASPHLGTDPVNGPRPGESARGAWFDRAFLQSRDHLNAQTVSMLKRAWAMVFFFAKAIERI
jgi:hypothetical protein